MSEQAPEPMGKLIDFGQARRRRSTDQGVPSGVLGRLIEVLGLPGNGVTNLSAADLERLAASVGVDPDIRNVAQGLANLLQRDREAVKEKEE